MTQAETGLWSSPQWDQLFKMLQQSEVSCLCVGYPRQGLGASVGPCAPRVPVPAALQRMERLGFAVGEGVSHAGV